MHASQLPVPRSLRRRSTFPSLPLLIPLLLLGQSAYASNAEIDQADGSENLAEIVQEDAPTASADIYQDTYGNTAVIMQAGPADEGIIANITQWGPSHNATIDQSNVAIRAVGEVVQGGSGNTAAIIQEGVADVSAVIQQAGSDNVASAYQTSDSGTIAIDQVGDNHFAQVEQATTLLSDDVSIYQGGMQNSILVLQERNAGGSVVTHQIGANNLMEVFQTNEGVPAGVTATLTTEGDDNVILVEQDTFVSSLTVTQLGHANHLEVSQQGETMRAAISSTGSDFNTDSVDQDGQNNEVVINRSATDYSGILIDQLGASTEVMVEQHNSYAAQAAVTQNGTLADEAYIRQTGVDSTEASIVQDASSASTARIEQDSALASTAEIHQGLGNPSGGLIASIYQSGTSQSHAVIEQQGGGNEAHISQINTVDNTAAIWQEGSNNFAELILEGAGANSQTIVQIGDGYSTSIRQGGTNNTAVVSQM